MSHRTSMSIAVETVVKFWLGPVRLARNFGFAQPELTGIERKVRQEEASFLEKWNEYFSSNT